MWIIYDIRRIVKYLYQIAIDATFWCWAHDPPFGWFGDRFAEVFEHLTDLHYGLWLFAKDYEDLWERVVDVITESNIFQLLQKWLNYAEDAWNWVRFAWDNVIGILTEWWKGILPIIQSAIAQAVEGLDTLLEAWDTFWTVTFPNLVNFTWLGIWWNSRLEDVQSLINTAITDLGIDLEAILEIKDSILEFFADPFQWVYDKLDEFFERFW